MTDCFPGEFLLDNVYKNGFLIHDFVLEVSIAHHHLTHYNAITIFTIYFTFFDKMVERKILIIYLELANKISSEIMYIYIPIRLFVRYEKKHS